MSNYLDSYVEYLDSIVNLLRRYVQLGKHENRPEIPTFVARIGAIMKIMIIENEKFL